MTPNHKGQSCQMCPQKKLKPAIVTISRVRLCSVHLQRIVAIVADSKRRRAA